MEHSCGEFVFYLMETGDLASTSCSVFGERSLKMVKQSLFVVLFLLLMSIANSAMAQGKHSFEELLTKVKQFDRSVDFQALRFSYAETPNYNPYSESMEMRSAMLKALNEKEFQQALQSAQTILEKNYVDLDAHFACRIAYKELGDSDKASFHDFVLRGLLRSLMTSGDGKSPETAFQVISITEEYIVLDMLNLVTKDQKLVGLNTHQYDVMTAVHRETKEVLTVYFNVDIPFNWLNRQFKK